MGSPSTWNTIGALVSIVASRTRVMRQPAILFAVPVNRRGTEQIVRRRDPNVEHALHRRLKAEPFSVVAKPGLRASRVAEQNIARNQRRIGKRVSHVAIPFVRGIG